MASKPSAPQMTDGHSAPHKLEETGQSKKQEMLQATEEALRRRVADLSTNNVQLEDEMKWLRDEVEEAQLNLAKERAAIAELDNQRYEQVFSLSKDIFELKEKLAESERLRKAAENELEALMTSKDEIKDVHELKKAKMSLEKQLEESKRQIEELKLNKMQIEIDQETKAHVNASNSKKDIEVNMANLEKQFKAAISKLGEQQKARVIAANSKKEIKVDVADLEKNLETAKSELDEERKARVNAANPKKEFKVEAADVEKQLETAKSELDEVRKASADAANSRKKIKLDIANLEKKLEAATRQLNEERKACLNAANLEDKMKSDLTDLEMQLEVVRQLKIKQQQMHLGQSLLAMARAGRAHMNKQTEHYEKKAKQMEAECLHAKKDLAAVQRARMDLEKERDRLAVELRSSTHLRCSAADKNRKLEARIAQLEKEVEEQKTQNERLLEKCKRAPMKNGSSKKRKGCLGGLLFWKRSSP